MEKQRGFTGCRNRGFTGWRNREASLDGETEATGWRNREASLDVETEALLDGETERLHWM